MDWYLKIHSWKRNFSTCTVGTFLGVHKMVMQLRNINCYSCFDESPCFQIIVYSFAKYDKPYVHEYLRNCPLRRWKIDIFFVRVENKFCTRTKNICIAMQIFFLREQNLTSSFLWFFCSVIYDKTFRKPRKRIVQKEQTHDLNSC